jgi:ComF family protein
MPPICQLCGRPTHASGYCWRCRHEPLAIDGIRSAFLFEGEVRQTVHHLKYCNRQVLAVPLARLMAGYWRANPIPINMIVPVPLHPARQRERGYNQADLLARALGGMIDVPVLTKGLRRVRHTQPQVSLNATDRSENVRGAFIYQVSEKGCSDVAVNGRRVLVIDDVCTTGSTLEACSLALKTAGASTVWGFTLARAIYRESE